MLELIVENQRDRDKDGKPAECELLFKPLGETVTKKTPLSTLSVTAHFSHMQIAKLCIFSTSEQQTGAWKDADSSPATAFSG
ncbi:hypothetical protein WG66_006097 [Moniliophthora roreri]|nr:hypothetical protein WG66_004206 [Moniliophthora roreri]KAI3620021.1 hypothetical protein WG66_006097 [Moniliophthora roreri]